jgi:hypothetical protein
MKNNIKVKIIYTVSLVAILLGHGGIYNYLKDAIIQQHQDHIQVLQYIQKRELERLVAAKITKIATLSTQPWLIQFAETLMGGFSEFTVGDVDQNQVRKKLKNYALRELSTEVLKKDRGEFEKYLSDIGKLDKRSLFLQDKYLRYSQSSNCQGKKSDDSGNHYHKTHDNFQVRLCNVNKVLDFYDILLVNSENGDIYYTMKKEIDFARNINQSAFEDTRLRELYDRTLRFKSAQVKVSSVGSYIPSYGRPSFFLSVPLFRPDGKIFSIMFAQVNYQEFEDVLRLPGESKHHRSLQTYLVGEDFRLKSRVSTLERGHPLRLRLIKLLNRQNQVLTHDGKDYIVDFIKRRNQASELALSGKEGVRIGSWGGELKVLQLYTPFAMGEQKYALITEAMMESLMAEYTKTAWIILASLLMAISLWSLALITRSRMER